MRIAEGSTQQEVDETRRQNIDEFILEPVNRLLKPEARREFSVEWREGGIPVDVAQQTQVPVPVTHHSTSR